MLILFTNARNLNTCLNNKGANKFILSKEIQYTEYEKQGHEYFGVEGLKKKHLSLISMLTLFTNVKNQI